MNLYVNGVQLRNPKTIDVIIVSFYRNQAHTQFVSYESPYSNKPRALPST